MLASTFTNAIAVDRYRAYYKDRGQYSISGSILSVESNQNVESKTKNVESKTRLKNVESKVAFLLQEISYFEP